MPDIQQLFTSIAPTYDKLNRWLSCSRDRRWRARAIEAITPQLSLRVLDLCAGTLDMTVGLLRRFPQAQISAVDFCQRMLDLGLPKVPTVFRPQVELVCADAASLPVEAGTFDVALCAFGLRNLPDQHAALREVRRVLNDRGEFIILEFFQPTERAARWFAKTYGRLVVPLLGGWISKNRAAYEHLRDSTNGFYPLPAYRALLRQYGFRIRQTESLSGGIASLIIAEVSGHD